jgi:predicted permease
MNGLSPLHALIALVKRLAGLGRRDALTDDLDDEMSFHLAMRQDELRAQGWTPEEAARQARREFGNPAALRERSRDMWTFPSIESLWQDARYAMRSLLRAPGFTMVAVLALAVGIGANAAIFSLVNALVVRGLPFAHADRLVVLIGNVERQTVERRGNSYPDHLDWRAKATSFTDMAAYTGLTMTLDAADGLTRISVEGVSAPYFDVLGVSPAMGRTFRPDEDAVASRDAVTVLSDGLWRTSFGADPAIVGRRVTLSGRQYEVIGVMPAGFTGVTDAASLWVPFVMTGGGLDNRGTRGFQSVARLKDGVTREAAQAEMTALSKQLEAAYPATNEKRGVEVADLTTESLGVLQQAVSALMAAVLFVLLIACANVANLLIGRADQRRREIALRTALGAGHWRLVRQLLTESAVLAAVGAAAGLALAAVALRVLPATSPVALPSYVVPSLNVPVVLFTIGVTVLVATVLGLTPALHARWSRLADSLKDSARGSSARNAERVRGALVIAEVAFTVVLLVGAGLIIRSVANLAAVAPGYDPSQAVVLNMTVPAVAAPAPVPGQPPAPPAYSITADALQRQLAELPGVSAAALGSDTPLGGSSAIFYGAEGHDVAGATRAPRAYVHRVSAGFFDALRMPLRAGRTFTAAEMTSGASVAVVSEALAKRFWPNDNPIGKRIHPGGGAPTPDTLWLDIVGVVADTKYRGLPDNPTQDPDIFLPIRDAGRYSVVLRTESDPAGAAAGLGGTIARAVPGAVVYGVTPLDQLVRQQTASTRFVMWLLGVFAAMALGLAVIGLYGVMSYLVSQRTREFGIRLALGAGRGEILGLVLRRGLILIGIGVVLGAAGAAMLVRAIDASLYGVGRTDPAAAAAIALLVVTALAACAMPGYRATRVDPAGALRDG